MTDRVAWLRTQLDTDEAKAFASKQPHVYWYTDGHSDEASAFMAAFTADFVLRQVRAHRAILDLHVRGRFGECVVCGAGADACGCVGPGDSHPCATIKALVPIYSDRDGYLAEWSHV